MQFAIQSLSVAYIGHGFHSYKDRKQTESGRGGKFMTIHRRSPHYNQFAAHSYLTFWSRISVEIGASCIHSYDMIGEIWITSHLLISRKSDLRISSKCHHQCRNRCGVHFWIWCEKETFTFVSPVFYFCSNIWCCSNWNKISHLMRSVSRGTKT